MYESIKICNYDNTQIWKYTNTHVEKQKYEKCTRVSTESKCIYKKL